MVIVDNVDMDAPRRLLDVSVGEWVNTRLLGPESGPGSLVGSIAPTGFERVVRVLHPAGDGRPWAQVAARTGTVIHPLVQWCCIADEFDGSGRSGDLDPEEGSVPAVTLNAILDHCPPCEEVVQGVWLGFGSWTDVSEGEPVMPGWGGRSYRLFSTAKAAVTTWPGMTGWTQSANLIWPADHSWCIATEIDWDSTLVAGSTEMAEAMLADGRLEAFDVEYGDDLSWCGDTVNPRPNWLAGRCTSG